MYFDSKLSQVLSNTRLIKWTIGFQDNVCYSKISVTISHYNNDVQIRKMSLSDTPKIQSTFSSKTIIQKLFLFLPPTPSMQNHKTIKTNLHDNIRSKGSKLFCSMSVHSFWSSAVLTCSWVLSCISHSTVSHAFIRNYAKQNVLKGFVSNEMRPIALCQDTTVSSSLAQLQIPKALASDK